MRTMRLSIFLFLTGIIFYKAHSQSNGVTFFGNLDQRHGGDYSACWGYTAPDGREYVLTGTYTGTAIIDITDSMNIQEVAFISGPSSIWREMRTWRNYAYVVTEAGGGTQIIDLSLLPDTARLVTSFTYTSGSNNTASSHSIEIFDGYMYLNGCANWTGGGIIIFSLAKPTQPRFQSAYTQRYIHDCYVRNDTIFAAAIYGGGGVDIIDVRVKTNPVLIARITYAGSGTHNAWTTKDRHYVISTDEIGSTDHNLKFWDLSTLPIPPANPSATYTYNPSDIVHNVTVRGDYAYVAWYTAGLVVVNITDPINPQTAGWYDTFGGPSGQYDGAWAVYPYFPSGKIAISDITSGTWIFRFNNLAPRRRVNLLSPVNGDTIRSTAPFSFRWTSASNPQRDPHYYTFVGTGTGLDISTNVYDTTFLFTDVNLLQYGGMYTWYGMTRDEFNVTASRDTFSFVFLPNVARITTSADTLDFGVVTVGSTISRPLQISNTGRSVLVIDSILITNNTFTSDFTGPVSIQPESSYTTIVSFTPADSLLYQSTLQIFSNAFQQSQIDVMLLGTGDFPTGVHDLSSLPLGYALDQNFPNPFNPSTTIRFSIPPLSPFAKGGSRGIEGEKGGFVSLKVYDLLGNEVATLVNEELKPGTYVVIWDASGFASSSFANGSPRPAEGRTGGYASGVYFYRLTTPNFTDVKKMLLLK